MLCIHQVSNFVQLVLHHTYLTLDNCIEILSNRDQTRYMEPCHWATDEEEELTEKLGLH